MSPHHALPGASFATARAGVGEGRHNPREYTILVVDDELAVRRVLARMLSDAGYSVVAAAGGLEAQRLLESQPFDAVLSDISMPGIDGIELLRSVREVDADLPVILLTGVPTDKTAISAVNLHATAYLAKPIVPSVLVAQFEKVFKLRQLAQVRREATSLTAPAIGTAVPHVDGLAVAFEHALSGLFMVYQPIVSWSRRTVFAYEALARSSEPVLAHPAALFDAAERLSRLPELGRAIRADCAETFALADPGVRLFVNAHPADLQDAALYGTEEPLRRLASRVVIEITERARIDDIVDLRDRIHALRSAGFRIAIDDIGAGYAGLNSFALTHPEFVKLDMALVREIDRSPTKQRVARMLVELCGDLGIAVIGEGVETVAERDTLVSLGCDLLQGYLLARPGEPFPPVVWST